VQRLARHPAAETRPDRYILYRKYLYRYMNSITVAVQYLQSICTVHVHEQYHSIYSTCKVPVQYMNSITVAVQYLKYQ